MHKLMNYLGTPQALAVLAQKTHYSLRVPPRVPVRFVGIDVGVSALHFLATDMSISSLSPSWGSILTMAKAVNNSWLLFSKF